MYMYVQCTYIHVYECKYTYMHSTDTSVQFHRTLHIASGQISLVTQASLSSAQGAAVLSLLNWQTTVTYRGPTTVRLFPLNFVGNSQLILQILTNPLCQFGWQPTQDRIEYTYSNHFGGEWGQSCRDKEGAGCSANLILAGLRRLMSRPTQPVEQHELACQAQHVRWMYMYIHGSTLYEHVHTHHSSICTWTRQNITYIFDCVCWWWNMASFVLCHVLHGSCLCWRNFSMAFTPLTSPTSSVSSSSHHLSHFVVLALPVVCISKLIVWVPTCCTLADRAQAVDSNLSTIHSERSWSTWCCHHALPCPFSCAESADQDLCP